MQPVTPPINVLVEGITDEAVVRCLLAYAGLTCGTVYGKSGKSALLERLPNREDIVPRQGSGSRVGPGYAGRLIEFVMTAEHRWRPGIAAQRSDSLWRCIEALQALGTKPWERG
jgi:hypothetical protein